MSDNEIQYGLPRRSPILKEPEKREAMPQNSQCSNKSDEGKRGHHGANIGHAVPFGQMLSYGANGSPTITITKTLFSAAEVTSTRTDDLTSTGASNSSGTSDLSFNPTASAFIGVTKANHVDTGSTTIATTTDSSKTTQTKSASATASNAAGDTPAKQPGVVAGSVIGSMAAFSMIGILIWYFCIKKQGKKKFKVKLNLRRRKSSDVKTPQIEGQSLERTRTIMLQQAELNKSRENDLNHFFTTSVTTVGHHHHNQDLGHYDNARSTGSQMENPKIRPSWIGLAMSSSTPPNTPPLPRSNSQKSNAPSVGTPSTHPSALTPGIGSVRNSASPSIMPAPLKAAMKPVPIITSPRLTRLENVSPLSPRGMLSAMSNTTKGAWRRASQALSPSSYQPLRSDGPEGAEYPRVDRRPSVGRNPELEIGAQTDKGWDGQWI
ncbi:hypothetical protein LTR70_005152 [Exophiala xenobiotica]|uniref:Uncharacterized protein n=1 Tax=Lithohypha guttulata TaxID=1690604 RepID=A0ABR0KAQ3_9EURO|nr:hypothetical protein LTR24_004877 [Lithohypha guttulata]KAK5319250.1 hypothetical protein LTR70_005152 [Exophiala xenobiotica]